MTLFCAFLYLKEERVVHCNIHKDWSTIDIDEDVLGQHEVSRDSNFSTALHPGRHYTETWFVCFFSVVLSYGDV